MNSPNTCAGLTFSELINLTYFLACNSPCDSCSGTATTCTGCSGITPYLYNSYCYANCPFGTFQSTSGATCSRNNISVSWVIRILACSSSCATCFGAASPCTGCSGSTPYLYNNICWTTCPSGSYANSPSTCAGNFSINGQMK